MKKIVLALIAVVVFSSHDMYLKLDTYFLQPNTSARIQLFNGTFDNSDNAIARDRMADVSLVGNGTRTAVDTAQWSEADNTTILNFKTGAAGTWVAGVSTRARNIEMSAADFNDYLEHDGVLDMLEWRKANKALDADAVEKYAKHVKAIFQVGDHLTDDWQTALGYPIEFIPLDNPYDLHPGHAMQFQLLFQGEPLANQLVYIGSVAKNQDHSHDHEHAEGETHSHQHADGEEAGHSHDHDEGEEHSHDHEHAEGEAHDHSHESDNTTVKEEDHHHDELTQVRTDAEGKLSVDIAHQGIWYLRTIHLVHSEEEGLTHESNWATLTFEVGEGHSHTHAEDDHSHEEEHGIGIPSYAYWIASLALLAALFFWFNRKN